MGWKCHPFLFCSATQPPSLPAQFQAYEMNFIIAIVIALTAMWVVMFLLSIIRVAMRADKSKIKELSDIQGGAKGIWIGCLLNAPKHWSRDFRVINGLEYHNGRYVTQSRLSVEALRSVFFSK